MTKQEELEHINNLIELKVRSENLVAEKKGYGIVNTSEQACINPISNDLIQEEFVKIYNCQQPSLVVVPESFFHYCNTMPSQQPIPCIQPVVQCANSIPVQSTPSTIPCCCGCNNNCCCCNAPAVTPKKYHCSVAGCNYSTIRKSDMKIHFRTHTGEKPYKCPYADCPYAAVTRSILVIHIRTHTGEKPLKCTFPNCNYSSANHSNLKVHMRTHTGEKPFKCSVEGCSYASITSSDLKKHMKVHAHGKMFKCPQESCSYSCCTRNALKKHLQVHAQEPMISKCGFVSVHDTILPNKIDNQKCGSI